MKRKLDFVTNSSSTSFCVWGQTLDTSFEYLSEKTKKLIYDEYVETRKKYYDGDYVSYEVFTEKPNKYRWEDALKQLLEYNGFDCSTGPYDENGIMTGIHPTDMSENQTLKEFKNEIENRYEKLGIPGHVYFIEEGWYDG